ncbi:MAG: hypothetical protein ACREVE_16000 [Gammaproteobacteria bacterium]
MRCVNVVNEGDRDLAVIASQVADKILSGRLSNHYITAPTAAFS